jgi:hypothetical protein
LDYSYRVNSDAATAEKLYFLLNDGVPHRAFLDRFCLHKGKEFEEEFLHHLWRSRVVLLLVSEGAIKGIQTAHIGEGDNLLLEVGLSNLVIDASIYAINLDSHLCITKWELSLELHQKGLATVVPLFLGREVRKIMIQFDELGRKVSEALIPFDAFKIVFPNAVHAHPRCIVKHRNISETMRDIFAINGFNKVWPSTLEG